MPAPSRARSANVETAWPFARVHVIGVAASPRRRIFSCVACGVPEVKHHIRDRRGIDLVVLRRELDPPPADRTGALEREVLLVPEVDLEDTGVVLPGAGRDRLDRAEAVAEPRVIVGRV